ncbi:VQ motif-containing protein [Perilla frutescens var. frutescens]|nr:VQ motif-containing protein [Perilla frutescens var. frutescens]
MQNSNYQESSGSINLDHLTFDDVPDFAPSPKASCSGPKGSIGKAIKRRSRASRKAPTTLLTADANNFRALVQQFTGYHSAAPLLRAYKGPINLNFEQCSYYPKRVVEQKQKKVEDYKQLHEELRDEGLCRINNNHNNTGARAAAIDLELFDHQNPRDIDDDALTYDHLELMDNFLGQTEMWGTADYSTVSPAATMDDDGFWGY